MKRSCKVSLALTRCLHTPAKSNIQNVPGCEKDPLCTASVCRSFWGDHQRV